MDDGLARLITLENVRRAQGVRFRRVSRRKECCGGRRLGVERPNGYCRSSRSARVSFISAVSLILVARHERESGVNCLTEALTVAREQSALALELRTTMVLARLLSEDGQRDQARHTLALVYDRFTEGFETADLKQARVMLEDLR